MLKNGWSEMSPFERRHLLAFICAGLGCLLTLIIPRHTDGPNTVLFICALACAAILAEAQHHGDNGKRSHICSIVSLMLSTFSAMALVALLFWQSPIAFGIGISALGASWFTIAITAVIDLA